jgi:putative membrane protein
MRGFNYDARLNETKTFKLTSTHFIKKTLYIPAFFFMFWLMGTCISPQNLKHETKESDSIISYQEFYLKEAYIAGLFEIKASELAINKSTNTEVKEYAEVLAGINQRITNDISQMAFSRQIKLPLELSNFQQGKLQNLLNKESKDFDNEYILQLVNNQRWTADFYEKVSKESEDNEISTWAIHSLPTIKDNLEKSRVIQKKLMTDQ